MVSGDATGLPRLKDWPGYEGTIQELFPNT
jgi:hypothetical protein